MSEYDFMSKFAKTLKDLMKNKGLTVKGLAEISGIPRTSLTEWTNGREPTMNENIVKLARILDVSVEYLITGQHPEEALLKKIISSSKDEFITIHEGIYKISIEKKKQ